MCRSTFVAAVARLLRRGVGKLRNQALEVAKDVEKLGGLLWYSASVILQEARCALNSYECH